MRFFIFARDLARGMGVRRLNGWPRRRLGESALLGGVPPPGEPVKGGRTVETIGDVPPRMEQSCHPPQAAAKRAAPRSARSSARADGSSGSAGCGAELFRGCAVNEKQSHFVKICTLTPFLRLKTSRASESWITKKQGEFRT